jgi:hypothetical protein
MSELGRRAGEYYQESFVFEDVVNQHLRIYERALTNK